MKGSWCPIAAAMLLLPVLALGQAGRSITLSEEARKNLKIELARVETQDLKETLEVRGLLREQADRSVLVTPPTRGRIAQVFFKVPDAVKKGDVLLLLHCPELEKLRTELALGLEKAKVLEAEVERVRALVEKGLLPRRDLARAEADDRLALSQAESSRRSILLLGVTEKELDALLADPGRPAWLPVHAPIGGRITYREAYVGEMVEPARRLFQIMDTSVLWAEGDIFERDVPKVAEGMEASLVLRPFQDWRGTGTIRAVSADLNAQKRTAHIWIEVANPDGKLKPQMAVDIAILVETAAMALAVPKEAVLEEGGEHFVFVANGDAFLRQAVVTGRSDYRYAEIQNGLYEGDMVVTRGNHELRQALSGQGPALGSDGHLHKH